MKKYYARRIDELPEDPKKSLISELQKRKFSG